MVVVGLMSGSEFVGKSSVRSSNATSPPLEVRVNPSMSPAGPETDTGVVTPVRPSIVTTGLITSVPLVR